MATIFVSPTSAFPQVCGTARTDWVDAILHYDGVLIYMLLIVWAVHHKKTRPYLLELFT
jgi:hypothetical protein